MDAVDAVRSEIVVYGGEDIVFGAKMSNQWMQYAGTQWNSGIWWWGHLSLVQKCQTRGRSMHWMQYAVEQWYMVVRTLSLVQKVNPVDTVCSGHSTQWNSGIWWWGHCLWCKKVKPVDAVRSGHSTYTVDTMDAVE